MDSKVGRNDLCPCGSGKKFKKCCMNTQQRQKRESFSPKFSFEPGSYGGNSNFYPSIACQKQTAPNTWEYHFVIVKLDIQCTEEATATYPEPRYFWLKKNPETNTLPTSSPWYKRTSESRTRRSTR